MKCSECRYWEGPIGHCRRYPPDQDANLAESSEDDWCGEWTPSLEEYRAVKASEIATPTSDDDVVSMEVGWQPIETVPKDTPVLAYCKRWYDQVDIAIHSDYWYANGGRLDVAYYPTHWMSLPEPPE